MHPHERVCFCATGPCCVRNDGEHNNHGHNRSRNRSRNRNRNHNHNHYYSHFPQPLPLFKLMAEEGTFSEDVLAQSRAVGSGADGRRQVTLRQRSEFRETFARLVGERQQAAVQVLSVFLESVLSRVRLTKQTSKQAKNQSTNQPINQSTNQPINQSTNRPIDQSTK